MPFRRYSGYLREKYGEPVYRISVDAGFTCPHRRADGSGGCSFCDASGSRAAYQEESFEGRSVKLRRDGKLSPERFELIRLQIERGRRFLCSRYGAKRYILYFQAFTNTFGPIDRLRQLYDFALHQEDFVEFIVSTRPDCVARAHAELLSSYRRNDREVWVELGLQSFHDETLKRIGRGHSTGRFYRAFSLLRERGIKITVHLIFGLPGEGRGEIRETVKRLAELRPEGVKIHNLNVAAKSALEDEYRRGELVLASGRRHLEYLIDALERLPEDTVIQRISCDTRKDSLVAPLNFPAKSRLYTDLEEEMRRRGSFQGRLCRPCISD